MWLNQEQYLNHSLKVFSMIIEKMVELRLIFHLLEHLNFTVNPAMPVQGRVLYCIKWEFFCEINLEKVINPLPGKSCCEKSWKILEILDNPLFLRKNPLLGCWGLLSLLNWIGNLTLSLLPKLPPRKWKP